MNMNSRYERISIYNTYFRKYNVRRSRGEMDTALPSGGKDCGFESRRDRKTFDKSTFGSHPSDTKVFLQ